MTLNHVPLSDVASLQAGIGFPLDLQGKQTGAYPFAKVGDISRCGRSGTTVLSAADHYIDDVDLAALRGKLIPAGSVLFAKIGEAIRQNHRVVSGCELLIDNNAMAAIPGPNTDSRFLYHFLKTVDFYRLAPATTVPAIRKSDLEKLPTPFPSLSEQRRIATILDKADELRAKRREALAQLDSLTQSIFIEMFGDPRANEREWPTSSIGSLVSEMRGGAPLEPDDFTDSGFPILHKGAIKPLGRIQVDAKKKTFASIEYAESKPNCIADRKCVAVTLRDLVPTGPSIGLAADLQYGVYDKYLLAQGAYAFHLDSKAVTPEYFVHLSNMPTFRYVLLQNAVGSTQIHIRTPIYMAIKVPRPPIALQREFSKRVRVIDEMKLQHNSSLAELKTLFASLQHRAFAGEL